MTHKYKGLVVSTMAFGLTLVFFTGLTFDALIRSTDWIVLIVLAEIGDDLCSVRGQPVAPSSPESNSNR